MSYSVAFFKRTLFTFLKKPRVNFNFIKVSQESNKTNKNFDYYLGGFLDLCLESQIPDDNTLTFVSLVIVLDSYPLSIHYKFSSAISVYII